MLPKSLSIGVFELIASLGSTLRLPGPASGMREILTYFDRSLCPPRSAPTSRGGTSARVSAAARSATMLPARPVDAAMKFLRDRPLRPRLAVLSSTEILLRLVIIDFLGYFGL